VGKKTPQGREIMGLDITRYEMAQVTGKSRIHPDETIHNLGYIRGGCHNDIYTELKLPTLYQIFGIASTTPEPRYDNTLLMGRVEILRERIPKALHLARQTMCGLVKAGYNENTREMRAIDAAIEMLEDMLYTGRGLYLEFIN